MEQKPENVANYEGGKEGLMSGWAGFILFLGIVALIASVIASGFVKNPHSSNDWDDYGLDWSLVIMGLTAFIQSVLTWLVLSGGAEIIRLLKKLNGLNYGGSISDATAVWKGSFKSHPTLPTTNWLDKDPNK